VKKAALVGPALRGAASRRSLDRRGVSKGRVAGGRIATTGFSQLIFPNPWIFVKLYTISTDIFNAFKKKFINLRVSSGHGRVYKGGG
jgi:hypothetical protein